VQLDRNCPLCPRLVELRSLIRETHPDYHAAPVPPFGARSAHLLVVGLAPGLHGGNRWGRPFTGDAASGTLMAALARAGFANQHESSHRADGLRLLDARVTNALKCVPPGNRPTGAELVACSGFLAAEIGALARGRGKRCVLALGHVAHRAVMRAIGVRSASFRHGVFHAIDEEFAVVDCYHPSRLNMNTGRLSDTMLDAVLGRIRRHLGASIL
jgi:uracil-DNA glycosylase family 4